jgi:pimeloyl-ACP methyl ester carboxylesterase
VLAEPNTADAIQAGGSNGIRPFRSSFSEGAVDDLRRRVAAARLPERETVADFSQGVPLATVQNLQRYWANDYDWRRAEANLNRYPQFITEIDGLDIHFIHVRSRHPNALPLIVTHGWPGSILEQIKIIEPLTDPTAHGGRASDAFDVIIPSMPGYGFSGKPTETGWGPERIATAWITLMRRLGYTRFAAQGGDWGAVVTEMIGVQAPPELVGLHVNMPGAIPVDVNQAAFGGAAAPDGLSAEELHAFDQLKFFYTNVYYAFWMSTRPQTGVAFSDSPVGLATFLCDHDRKSTELIARVFDGQREGLTRDDILDNASLFWLTNTAVSSARLYWENKLPFFTPKGVNVPVAVSAFADELYQTPRSWAERAYPNLIFYNKHDRGGHFAAWEQPGLLTADLRAAFRNLRTA